MFSLLKEGVDKGVFPGAVAGISTPKGRFVVACGYRSYIPFLEPMEDVDIFDLASLTKPLALVLTYVYFASANGFDLEKPLGEFEFISVSDELGKVPVFRFFNHTAGLKAWHPFFEKRPLTLEKLIKEALSLPLEYSPGSKSLYSDLGYFLLTYIFEKHFGLSFYEGFLEIKKELPLSSKAFFDFLPLGKVDEERLVPTSVCPWERKILRGIVEDENTRALGGVSGVAGLFANVQAVLDVLEFLVELYHHDIGPFSSDVFRKFATHREENSEFALGFMVCDESPSMVRHTGFTGTSFLVDLEKGNIAVLLTNRVHPHRNNLKIKEFRKAFHKLVEEVFFL